MIKKKNKTKFYIQFEYWIHGGWMGSLWPSNERKSMHLHSLLVVLMEIDFSMKLSQSFRKVTDFSEAVTVYGTDAFGEETLKGPTTKLQFHINTEESLIELINQMITRGKLDPETEEGEEMIKKISTVAVKRFFFELQITCREARKWGCSENYIVQK